jgi:4-oxalocrotonate tautomerase
MPFVQVKVIEGVFGPEEKGRIVRAVTDAMVSVEGEAMRGVTWVTIEEVASGSWAIGGTPLTTADVTSMRTATPASV